MSNTKIVYSLRLHIALLRSGFKPLCEMKNPSDNRYNCWIYEITDDFQAVFDALMGEGGRNG